MPKGRPDARLPVRSSGYAPLARIMAKKGHSQKEIAEKLGVSDRMVRKYLKPDFGIRQRKRRASLLTPIHEFIDELLEDDPFINLVPVYERLQRRRTDSRS